MEKKRSKRINKRIKRYIKIFTIVFIVIFIISIGAYYVVNITTTWIVVIEDIDITLNHAPNGSTIDTNTTYFNWTGTGGDPEVNLTYYWYADINQSFTSPLRRAISLGEIHNYTCDPLPDGTWYWRVEGTDGTRYNVSETYVLHVITNMSNNFPFLSNATVVPTIGQTSTTFTYYVNFTDPDNDTASYVNVSIDDVQYSMSEDDAGDINTTDGKLYTYSTLLSRGWHNYSFVCSDGIAVNITTIYDNPYVNDEPDISLPSPGNNSMGVPLQPTCEIYVSDVDGDIMNISFASNYSGPWIIYQTNHSVNNGTYTWNFSGANLYTKKYWWRVYANDSYTNTTDDSTFCFTTVLPPAPIFITNTSPANGETDLCPCCITLCANVVSTHGRLMNITFYSNLSLGYWDYFWLGADKNVTFSNVTNGTYCFSVPNFNRYSYTYYWNISLNDGVNYTESTVFSFSTAEDEDDCNNTIGNIEDRIKDDTWIVGVAIVFSMLPIGYIIKKRREEDE